MPVVCVAAACGPPKHGGRTERAAETPRPVTRSSRQPAAPPASQPGGGWGPNGAARTTAATERPLPTAFRRSDRTSTDPAAAGKRVSLELYVMSKCPFGTMVEKELKVVSDAVGDRLDLRIDYIMSETNGKLSALHGASEVEGNIVELCVMKHYPRPSDYLAFLDCQNLDYRSVPNRWRQCARQGGMAEARIDRCRSSGEGQQLARESMMRSRAAGAHGSPTIVVAGQRHQGGRSVVDLLRAICPHFGAEAPARCAALPKPVVVDAIVLNDRRCKHCSTAGAESNLRSRFFPRLNVRRLDYSSAEGRKLFRDLKLKYLPAWLFSASVEKSPRFDSIRRWCKRVGPYHKLRMPAHFDPTAEICDNGIDDTGNSKVDCADASCAAKLICRSEKKRQLQVFIMSQCPYGTRAVTNMEQVLQQLGGGLRSFEIHYIADETPGGFRALHGQSEVDENIRQLCARRLYPRGQRYLSYIWCRNKNYRSSAWRGCARHAGLSVARIERCVSRQGRKLLAEDIKIAKQLKVSGSPTWLVNNRHKESGLKAEDIVRLFCKHNPGVPGC